MTRFCGGCGAPRSSSGQQFCAQCGTPFSSDLAGAQPAPPAPPAYDYDYAVPTRLAPIPSRSGRRAPVGRILGVGALVAALGGAGLVGWQVLGPGGGAETPEEAVSAFVAAIVEQDGVGALSMVNPAEVEGLDGVYESARDRLEERGVVGGGDLTDALDVSVSGLEFEVDELGEDAARVVLVSGDYTVYYDPTAVPDALDFVADANPDPHEWSGDIVEDIGYSFPDADWDNDRADPFVEAVRVDGGWYVTLLGTLVEASFGGGYYEDISRPDYDTISDEVEPVVGETPEDVVDNLVDAINDGDVEDLLANFPTNQVLALRPYARTVQGILREEGVGFEVAVDHLDLETEERGDRLLVTVDRAEATGSVYTTDDQESGSVAVDGSCVSAWEYDDEPDTVCLDQEVEDYLGVDTLVLVLSEVDDGYQLDPIATAVENATRVLDEAPDSAIDEALDEICWNTTYDEERCY